MKWQLRGWRWKKRKERDQRWRICTMTTLRKDYHSDDRLCHPAFCLGLDFSLYLPFPFLLSLEHHHGVYTLLHVCSEFHQGSHMFLQGIIFRSTTEADAGKTVPQAQMGSEHCSAFPALNHQPLFISGSWPHINTTSVTHESKCLGWREEDLFFALASARTSLLLKHKEVVSNKGHARRHDQWCVLKQW